MAAFEFKTGSFESDVEAIVVAVNAGNNSAKRSMCELAGTIAEAEQWRMMVRDFSKGKSHLKNIHIIAKERGSFITHLRSKGMVMTDNKFG